MFQQENLSLWGEYNYFMKARCIVLEWDITDGWNGKNNQMQHVCTIS